MADKKISELAAGTTPDGTETVPAVQSGATVGLTVDQIRSSSPVVAFQGPATVGNVAGWKARSPLATLTIPDGMPEGSILEATYSHLETANTDPAQWTFGVYVGASLGAAERVAGQGFAGSMRTVVCDMRILVTTAGSAVVHVNGQRLFEDDATYQKPETQWGGATPVALPTGSSMWVCATVSSSNVGSWTATRNAASLWRLA